MALSAGDDLARAMALNGVAGVMEKLGRGGEAGAKMAEALEAARAHGGDKMVAQAERNLAGLRRAVERKGAWPREAAPADEL